MTRQVLNFNEQIERVLELGVVLVLGGLLTLKYLPLAAVWFVPLLFFLVRPVVVWLGLWRSRVSRRQKPMMMWFGIRGIGSIYYLMYAVEHGLPRELAQQLTALTFATIVASIIIHGISATPLMNRYKNASGSQTSSS
jgi:NhaP-type Na+/H+ or K+/H+ antiporter